MTLLLVRHGQASFGRRDYDQLSPTGVRQAEVLGRHLTALGIAPDRVITGGMRRHEQTAEALRLPAGPTPSTDPAWAEFDHRAILSAHKPAYRSMTRLRVDMLRTGAPTRAFAETFDAALDRWTTGEHEDDGETWAAFTTRVEDGLSRAAEQAASDGGVTLVVTSAGPISWATTHLLGGDVQTWRRLLRSAQNTGVTRIGVGRHGPFVLSVNGHDHLLGADPALRTSR